MADMTVASTIYAQLGGRRFSVMTGAKNFVGGSDYLAFSLPRGAKNGINKVKVTLSGSDLYDVEFGRIQKFEYKTKAEAGGVYADNLCSVFETETGLYTSL